jgi:hypothetical protein
MELMEEWWIRCWWSLDPDLTDVLNACSSSFAFVLLLPAWEVGVWVASGIQEYTPYSLELISRAYQIWYSVF